MKRMTREQIKDVSARVVLALQELRPFLEVDGGDITLEEVLPEGTARVRLHGACSSCSMISMTMKAGVEQAIKRVAPEIVLVEAVDTVHAATQG